MSDTGVSIVRGRDAELERLGERLAQAQRGPGWVTAVVGPAGIGKSRLLAEAERMARRLSIRVLRATAAPERDVAALSVLVRALDPLVDPGAVAALRGGPGERLALIELVESHLERAALAGPVLVVIDDWQWADPSSTVAVAEISERLAGLPLAWLLASREPVGGTSTEELRLGPLEPASVASVLRDALGADPGPELLRLAASAAGNALAVVELAAGLRSEGLVVTRDGVGDAVQARLPRRAGDAMRTRLAHVSPSARGFAEVAAVIGRECDLAVLSEVLGPAVPDLTAGLAELRDAGLTEATEDGVAFLHDLLRDAVLATLPAGRRRALDRRIADVLVLRGAPPANVASRLAASAERGDFRATELLLAAARELAATHAHAAAGWARRGFELAAPEDPSRPALAAETTVLLHAANRPAEARAFAARTLDGLLSDEARGELLLSLAWLYDTSTMGQIRAGRDALALALSPSLRARHLTRLVGTLFTAGLVDRSDALIADARTAVAVVGGERMRYEGDVAEAVHLWAHGRHADGLAHIRAAELRHRDDPVRLGALAHWRSDFLQRVDEPDAAHELIAERAAHARLSGQVWEAQLWEQKRGRHLLEAGRPAEALATLEGLYAREAEHPSTADTMAIVSLGRAAVHVGNADRRHEALGQLPRLLAETSPETRRQAAFLLVVIALADGDRDTLTRALDVLTEDGRTALPNVFVDVCCGPVIVRAALADGRRAMAEEALAWQASLAAGNPGVVSLAGALAHARALYDGDGFDAAAALLAQSPRPLLHASALEDVGSIPALEEALAIYVRADARADQRRVRQRLRRLGVHHVPRPPAGSGHLRDLTETEADIVRSVAAGLTNREVAARMYISPHTVSTHVRHAFTKLGIRSRLELVRIVGTPPASHARLDSLTDAERRVAQRVARGLTNRAVAAELGISSNTVSSHLTRAYRKLGVRTRTELARSLEAQDGLGRLSPG